MTPPPSPSPDHGITDDRCRPRAAPPAAYSTRGTIEPCDTDRTTRRSTESSHHLPAQADRKHHTRSTPTPLTKDKYNAEPLFEHSCSSLISFSTAASPAPRVSTRGCPLSATTEPRCHRRRLAGNDYFRRHTRRTPDGIRTQRSHAHQRTRTDHHRPGRSTESRPQQPRRPFVDRTACPTCPP